MPKITTKATLTLNPLKLVIEQTELPSSAFPAAPVVVVDGEPVRETVRPLVKVKPFAAKLRKYG